MKTERLVVVTCDRNRPETVSLNVLLTLGVGAVRENLAFEASALGVDI